MGVKERKEKHKEDLRQKILDAAKTLFLKDGYEATSIRKIAAVIAFSPTTIYLYYKDKTDILYALHQEGFKLMRQMFMALVHVEDPFERLKALGRTYLQFAAENSEFYSLMFVMKEPFDYLDDICGNNGGEWTDGIESFGFLLDTITDCQQFGYFKGQDVRIFSLLIWSTVHGLCTLNMHGHLDHALKNQDEEVSEDEILNRAFKSFMQLLELGKA